MTRLIREILLNLAAVGGAVCILLVVVALAFDITLIMFRTGSMSPAIPAGSVAVVRAIPAAEVRTGDVVTVDRPGDLPITHRVTSVTATGGSERSITMRGDANTSDDPAPYAVHTVRRVLWSVPGLAPVIVRLSEPPVLAGITLTVAGLVTWGSWPPPTGRAPSGGSADTPSDLRRRRSRTHLPRKVAGAVAPSRARHRAAARDGVNGA